MCVSLLIMVGLSVVNLYEQNIFFSILTLLASTGRCEALSYMLTKNPAKAHVSTVYLLLFSSLFALIAKLFYTYYMSYSAGFNFLLFKKNSAIYFFFINDLSGYIRKLIYFVKSIQISYCFVLIVLPPSCLYLVLKRCNAALYSVLSHPLPLFLSFSLTPSLYVSLSRSLFLSLSFSLFLSPSLLFGFSNIVFGKFCTLYLSILKKHLPSLKSIG